MTTQHSGSGHSTRLNHAEEIATMNLEIIAQMEAQRRETEIRHRLDERSLERAANRRRHRTAASGADGPGLLSRFIGWLAPNRVATASGTTAEPRAPQSRSTPQLLAPQPPAVKAGDACASGMDCTASTAHRAA
jgi:hypothetical protein